MIYMIFLFHIMSIMYSSEDIKADHAPTIAERVHEKKELIRELVK